MQYQILHVYPSDEFLNDGNTHVSFKRFVDFLAEKSKETDSLRSKFYRFVLKHFKKQPELLQPINISKLKNYAELINLLEGVVFPNLADEKNYAFALGVPMSPVFFLATKAFHDLFKNRMKDELGTDKKEIKKIIQKRHNKLSYSLILERFYNYQPAVKEDFVHMRTDKETGLTRYFSLNIDNRFVEVEHRENLPSINVNQAQQLLTNAAFDELEKMLPSDHFSFSGFSLVTATDITPNYALHKMRSAIIKHNPGEYNKTYKDVIELLEQLCGEKNATFGLLPFLKLNERLVSYYNNYGHSIMIDVAAKSKLAESTFLEWVNNYFKNPQTIIKKECEEENKNPDTFYKAYIDSGYKGYALIPVFYGSEVAGLLEVGVKNANVLEEDFLNRIDSAIPILGQLMHQSQTEFAASITDVIRTHFTSIQPSVLWKFNEVAWNYLKSENTDDMKKLDEIRFEHVHPLYGAIDIRNSTIARNNALQKDLQYYFQLVKNTLKDIDVEDETMLLKLRDEANAFSTQANTVFTGNEESSLDSFMNKVSIYLNGINESHKHNQNLIKKYFKEIDEKHGKVYANRRVLENSMQYFNFIITGQLEEMQDELQKNYPVYFEKVRTDGIEYDIYLGESISPGQPYEKAYLNELRLIQLKNMAAITKLVHASAKSLPVPLQTTQLIYVNASSIDITFRMDEKRFDVEGGYNIRYHIVKKRIDKVHILDTGERLTQPGKLAIIYTQPQHEKEYMNYILQLQQQHILNKEIELLELEELQGVTGLKAIRVEVNLR